VKHGKKEQAKIPKAPLLFNQIYGLLQNGLIFLEQSYEKMGRKFSGPFLGQKP
jgi:hypothetical protein